MQYHYADTKQLFAKIMKGLGHTVEGWPNIVRSTIPSLPRYGGLGLWRTEISTSLPGGPTLRLSFVVAQFNRCDKGSSIGEPSCLCCLILDA